MNLVGLNAALLDSIRAEQFCGYDPFDGLNSKLLQKTPFYKSRLFRLAWLQLAKRSPINFRPLIFVPKMRNPKGIGLFISGLLNDYARTGDNSYLEDALSLGEWLLTQRSNVNIWKHACWGYHFDWQAKAFYVPAGKPNVITTVYVARALYDLGMVLGDNRFVDVALDAARFIVENLYCVHAGRTFFSYIPGETAFVHNASLWGAAWVAFAGKRLQNLDYQELAIKVASQSVGEQFENGAWVYGSQAHHNFIDGFHTGYNLEALKMIAHELSINNFDRAIDKGLAYYIECFILPDGTVKYYNDSRYPLDMHSVAQAVFTLLKVGGRSSDLIFCQQVLNRAIDTLYLPSQKRFVYQMTKWFSNRVNYVRWTQAWAYCALAFYNRYVSERIEHA